MRHAWLHIRSALRSAVLTTARFAFTVRVGLLFSLASAVLTYVASRNLEASILGLLSFPIVLAAVFVWYGVRNLAGWSSLYAAEYRQQFGHGAKRLYVEPRDGSARVWFPLGIRCTVREPGGFTATSERLHSINGWVFPREFPELVPPAPGMHHAVWLERTRSGRWWKLVEFDFFVPESLQP